VSLSQPEFAAEGKTIGALVYFSSASENTARFVAGCRLQDEGINVYRIPLRAADPALNVREPYVIMVPTYGGGVVKKAVADSGQTLPQRSSQPRVDSRRHRLRQHQFR
jgi:Protein involved in ribonucleotide reduction